MTTYPKLKPSGIEWLGDIPEHWEVNKLKYVADIVLGKMLTNDDKGGYFLKSYLRAANLNWFTVDIEDVKEMWFSENEIQKFRLIKNDLLVSEGGEVGRTCIWKEELNECYIQNSVHKVTILKPNNPFYYLFHFSLLGDNGHFNSVVNRISIAHLTGEKLKEIEFVTPPAKEQNRIVEYLSEAASKIDTLITNKQKLIELLKEERAGIINHAVTKGIDPNVKLKPSGIEWLGDIPEHWEIKKLKYLGETIIGITYSPNEISNSENGTLVLRSSNIQNAKLCFNDCVYIMKNIPEKLVVIPGDILICARNGSARLVGKNVCIEEENAGVTFGAFMSVFRSKYWKYISCFLNSDMFKAQSGIFSTSTINQLTSDVLNNMHIAFPLDSDEREKITNYIFKETHTIDFTISRIEKEIELMHEFRLALISEVVTGKICVF